MGVSICMSCNGPSNIASDAERFRHRPEIHKPHVNRSQPRVRIFKRIGLSLSYRCFRVLPVSTESHSSTQVSLLENQMFSEYSERTMISKGFKNYTEIVTVREGW